MTEKSFSQLAARIGEIKNVQFIERGAKGRSGGGGPPLQILGPFYIDVNWRELQPPTKGCLFDTPGWWTVEHLLQMGNIYTPRPEIIDQNHI
jgi:hypothetical protein